MQIPKLKEWREARGESQSSLAELAGTSDLTIRRLERGYGAHPSTAKKLAEALDIDIRDLMDQPPVRIAG